MQQKVEVKQGEEKAKQNRWAEVFRIADIRAAKMRAPKEYNKDGILRQTLANVTLCVIATGATMPVNVQKLHYTADNTIEVVCRFPSRSQGPNAPGKPMFETHTAVDENEMNEFLASIVDEARARRAGNGTPSVTVNTTAGRKMTAEELEKLGW